MQTHGACKQQHMRGDEWSNKTKTAWGNTRLQTEWKVWRARFVVCEGVLVCQRLIHSDLPTTAGSPVYEINLLKLNQHLLDICVVISCCLTMLSQRGPTGNHPEHLGDLAMLTDISLCSFPFLLFPLSSLSFSLSLCRLCLFWELVQQPTADQEDRGVEQGERVCLRPNSYPWMQHRSDRCTSDFKQTYKPTVLQSDLSLNHSDQFY